MKYCDNSPSILQWNSEDWVVPYISPVDGRQHRYFIDFWIKVKERDGDIKKKLIEVKPYDQIYPPKKPRKKSKGYHKKCRTYAVNNAKWFFAEEEAKRHGMEFLILTEKGVMLNDHFYPSKSKIF